MNPYFLDDARFRKIMCLKSLGRFDENPGPEGQDHAEVLMEDGKYRIDDL
jgi:hypothetical protein